MPKVTVDFSDADAGGRVRVPEDDYRLKVKEIKQDTSKAGNEMLIFTYEFVEGKPKGKSIKDYVPLTKEAAWKLKSILEAMDVTVPSKKVALQTDRYIGNELGATIGDDEYNGRISSKIMDYVSVDVLDGSDVEDEDEDVEPAPKAKKGKKNKKGKKAKATDDDEVEELDLDEI